MWTIFFDKGSGMLPQDFETLQQAKDYGEEVLANKLARYYQIEFC